MSKLQPVRGTRDIFGDEARRMTHVVETFASVAKRFSFQEISTPIFEFTDVFKRTLGEASDVVSKEMYTFEDRGGESLTLRPEYTAGIARAFLSNGMQQNAPVRLYSSGPMFRYERPQKGRYRQFHQLDAEVIGLADPETDVELIALGQQVLEELGIAGPVTLHLNTLGDAESRAAYRAALVDYFSAHEGGLSDDSKERLTKNPLRILDSKDEGDKAIVANAPRMSAHLSEEAQAFFDRVRAGLDAIGINYVHNETLVRGLDYYCHTAYEFITDALGAQGTVIGGGRYDGLIEQMGGPSTPGSGWAGGIERLAMLLDETPATAQPVFVLPMGDTATVQSLAIADALRRAGVSVIIERRGNMAKRMKRANKANARTAVILGDDEMARGEATVKDMASGEQSSVALDQLAGVLAQH